MSEDLDATADSLDPDLAEVDYDADAIAEAAAEMGRDEDGWDDDERY